MEESEEVTLPFWVIHHVGQAREALGDVCSKLESQVVRNPDLPEAYREIVRRGFVALSLLDSVANCATKPEQSVGAVPCPP